MAEIAALLTALGSILGAIAWPTAVVIVVLRFSKNIASLGASFEKRIRAGDDFDLTVGKVNAKIRSVAAERIEAIVISESTEALAIEALPSTASAILGGARVLGPGARVAAIYSLVQQGVRAFASERGIEVAEIDTLNGLRTRLVGVGLASSELESALADFEDLTSLTRTIPERGLDEATVDAYQALAAAILGLLSSTSE